jgi:plasmid stabilization system protein ParE
MRRCILAPEAALDLVEIWRYLKKKANVEIAEQVERAIREKIVFLASMPGAGHCRRDLTDEPGSACGTENILGRWQDYRDSGHGGNKKLKERDPNDLLFTILQRASPDMERDELAQLEESWKIRLHTRDHGLNDN